MGGRDCVQDHCVARTRSRTSFHTIQCFHRVMEKFPKQRKFSLYSGNSAKFAVGIMADRRGVGAVVWSGGWERVMTF